MKKLQLISTKHTTIKRLLIFIPLIFLSITVFAAFPVNTHLSGVDSVSNNHLPFDPLLTVDTSLDGTFSWFFGVLGVVAWIWSVSIYYYSAFLIFSIIATISTILAVHFGIRGLNNKSKGAKGGLIFGGIGIIIGLISLILATTGLQPYDD